MTFGFAWPDILIAIIILIATYKGWARGFVSELAGAVAVVAALITPWYYNGFYDDRLQHALKLGPGSAHVIAMFLAGILTYIVVIAISWVINRFAKLPVLNIFNSLAGAAIGLGKGAVLMWFILFVVLYFPLSPDIRDGLHHSQLAAQLTKPNPAIDKALLATTPWFAKAFLYPYFHRHHV
jgi:uncharacterized membrane protein required for colicin V production